jgi:hypothetical protein
LQKIANMYHRQNFAVVSQEQEEVEELYESVVNLTSSNP